MARRRRKVPTGIPEAMLEAEGSKVRYRRINLFPPKGRKAWPNSTRTIQVDVNLDAFAAFYDEALAAMGEGIYEAAKKILDQAREDAPVDTSALQRSGEIRPAEGGLMVMFGRDLPDARAVFQEFGTVNHPAQPYLYPAARRVPVVRIVEKTIKSRMRGKGKKKK
jgi:hypothetical protein